MKVLIACEESQTVCFEFRKLGYEAYSCDLEPSSGPCPEFHIQGDAIEEAYSGKYDLMIAHPPCTYLSRAGARWLYPGGVINQQRFNKLLEAKEFFHRLQNAPIEFIAVENPTPFKVADLGPHTQAVQPYEFGHPYSKRTLLWLKNLPSLTPTSVLESWKPFLPSNPGGKKRGQKSSKGVAKNAKEASKTFPGIAAAMAHQWGAYVESILNGNVD